MTTPIKKALIPSIIIEVFLLIFCRFVSEADELASTILIIAAPLWLFTTLFAVFAYKDLKETIIKLHNDNEENVEH